MYEQPPEQAPQPQTIQQEPQLEQRLSTYYGPLLEEQPLAQTAWHDLQRKLGPQPRVRNHGTWKHLLRRRKSSLVPEYVSSAYRHVAYEARMVHPLPTLQCAFKPGATPVVHVPIRLKPSIRLTLPAIVMIEIDGAVMDTLLATGLARYTLSVRWSTLFRQALCLCPAVLSLLLPFFCKGPYLIAGIVLMLPLIALSWVLLNQLRRHVCLAADALAVLWLGRERICQGLHGLVDYQRVSTPVRSGRRGRLRRPGRQGRSGRWVSGNEWSAPSLAERIERVCSEHSTIFDEHLTLVR